MPAITSITPHVDLVSCATDNSPTVKRATCCHARRRRQHGFTLVEVVVASGILVLAGLSVLTSFSYARRTASRTENRLACMHIARQAMETLRTESYTASALSLGTKKTIPGLPRSRGYYNVVAGSDGLKTKDVTVIIEWIEPTGLEGSVSLTTTLSLGLHK